MNSMTLKMGRAYQLRAMSLRELELELTLLSIELHARERFDAGFLVARAVGALVIARTGSPASPAPAKPPHSSER